SRVAQPGVSAGVHGKSRETALRQRSSGGSKAAPTPEAASCAWTRISVQPMATKPSASAMPATWKARRPSGTATATWRRARAVETSACNRSSLVASAYCSLRRVMNLLVPLARHNAYLAVAPAACAKVVRTSHSSVPAGTVQSLAVDEPSAAAAASAAVTTSSGRRTPKGAAAISAGVLEPWQLEEERGSRAWCRLGPDAPAVKLDDLLAQRDPDPRSFVMLTTMAAVEHPEDIR